MKKVPCPAVFTFFLRCAIAGMQKVKLKSRNKRVLGIIIICLFRITVKRGIKLRKILSLINHKVPQRRHKEGTKVHEENILYVQHDFELFVISFVRLCAILIIKLGNTWSYEDTNIRYNPCTSRLYIYQTNIISRDLLTLSKCISANEKTLNSLHLLKSSREK
jgi:hypothetical protein